MTPERWHQITDIFDAAVAREPDAREAFLRHACREDESLRAEVDDLLRAHGQARTFGDTPRRVPLRGLAGPRAPSPISTRTRETWRVPVPTLAADPLSRYPDGPARSAGSSTARLTAEMAALPDRSRLSTHIGNGTIPPCQTSPLR
jgi:hypothetical protein